MFKSKEREKQYRHEYYLKNKEKTIKQNLEWRSKNKEKVKFNNKKSRDNTREHINKYKREYYHKRKQDPIYRLSIMVRNRIHKIFKAKNMRKDFKYPEYIGCSKKQLKEHIEKQFQSGMTWENYGINTWHIDHIIPLSSAKTEKQLYILSHFTNLQPLWAEENIKKSDNICHQM